MLRGSLYSFFGALVAGAPPGTEGHTIIWNSQIQRTIPTPEPQDRYAAVGFKAILRRWSSDDRQTASYTDLCVLSAGLRSRPQLLQENFDSGQEAI